MNYMQSPKLNKGDHDKFRLSYATSGAAAVDLRAAFYEDNKSLTLLPGERYTFNTGVMVEIPVNHVGIVAIRSGLARNRGLTLMNGIGIIDSDYRGEVGVCIYNGSNEAVTIEHGDRIAQLMVLPITCNNWNLVDSLTETDRGSGGFGSTGVN